MEIKLGVLCGLLPISGHRQKYLTKKRASTPERSFTLVAPRHAYAAVLPAEAPPTCDARAAVEAALGGPHGTWVDMTGAVLRVTSAAAGQSRACSLRKG